MAHWTQSMEAQIETQRETLRGSDPAHVARQSGAHWKDASAGTGTLSLDVLGAPLTVDVPSYAIRDAAGRDVPTMTQGLLMTYLVTASGAPRAGDWIAFRELPGGVFYHQAFTGYSGNVLARAIGDDLEAFKRGAKAAGGGTLTGFGDAAFEFRPLPGVWLAVVYWLGDEEDGFPPQANVLFDRAASEYLVTDGLAILASQLVRRILRGVRQD